MAYTFYFKGARYMSNTMFSAREALTPGSAYDRNKVTTSVNTGYNYPANADFMRAHDPLSYIDPRSRAFNGLNMPIPVPMLMPTAPPPPASFFNQNGQMNNQNAANQKTKAVKKFTTKTKTTNKAPRFQQQVNSQTTQQSQPLSQSQPQSQMFFKNGQTQNSQDISQGFSQNLLTQGPLSQGFLSQTGLSQAEFSQDSYLEHYQSQAEGLLSQDSTYQADPSYFAQSQPGAMSGSGIKVNNKLRANNDGQLSQF